jgi:glycosyltransferase involved in cell wall biosynthesis
VEHDFSLIIPTYNNPQTLIQGLEYLKSEMDKCNIKIEIIISDDGSDLSEPIDKIAQDYFCKYIKLEMNLGKGGAINQGLSLVTTQKVLYTDSDIPYYFEHLIDFSKKLDTDSIIAGERYTIKENNQKISFTRRNLGILFNKFCSIFLGLKDVDNQCGIKGIRKDICLTLFNNLTVTRYAFDAEILFRARKLGINIKSVPVRMRYNGESSLKLFRDGLRMIYDLLIIRLFSIRKIR